MKIEQRVDNIQLYGAGGTGSNLLAILTQLVGANKLETAITIIDGDNLENKNLLNQKFMEGDVGGKKAQILATRYLRCYPRLKLSYVDEYVYKLEDVLKRTKDSKMPVIIGCVDNNPTRQLLDKAFNELDNCIYIDAGNGDAQRVGQVVIGIKMDGKVISPSVGTVYPQIFDDKHTIEKATSGCAYTTGDAPQNISSNIYSSTVLFLILTNLLMFQEIKQRIVFFSAEDVTAEGIPI